MKKGFPGPRGKVPVARSARLGSRKGAFLKVGKADRIVELFKRLPTGSPPVELLNPIFELNL